MIFIVNYGFNMSKVFNVDCLLFNIVDSVKEEILTDSVRTLKESQKRWEGQVADLEAKNEALSNKLRQSKEVGMLDPQRSESKDKLPKASQPGQKPPKNQKAEVKEFDVQGARNAMQANEKNIQALQQKMRLIEAKLAEFDDYAKDTNLKNFDLVDFTGEKLFLSRKLEQQGTGIITPKKVYYLVRLENYEDPASEIKPLAYPGCLTLSLEEDNGTFGELNLFTQKDKKKPKK